MNSVCKDLYMLWMNLTIAILDFVVHLYSGYELLKHLSKCLPRMQKQIKPDPIFFMTDKISEAVCKRDWQHEVVFQQMFWMRIPDCVQRPSVLYHGRLQPNKLKEDKIVWQLSFGHGLPITYLLLLFWPEEALLSSSSTSLFLLSRSTLRTASLEQGSVWAPIPGDLTAPGEFKWLKLEQRSIYILAKQFSWQCPQI